MSHPDADTLTLLALGEEAEAVRAHVAECPVCREELAALRRVVDAARTLEPDERLPDPPAHLWAGISEELGLDQAVAVPLRARRRSRLALGLAAALSAVSVLAVLAFAFVLAGRPAVVAQTPLEALGESGIAGTASLLRDGETLALRLDLGDLPRPDGYYEVWLLAEGEGGLVSLGPLADRRTLPLPAGLTPESFPVVDVSAEDFDGDPAHSGRSLARADLSDG